MSLKPVTKLQTNSDYGDNTLIKEIDYFISYLINNLNTSIIKYYMVFMTYL